MRVSLADEHVVHRLRAHMGDAPLIAVKADRALDPASLVQHIPA